jgi:hypothetical protein
MQKSNVLQKSKQIQIPILTLVKYVEVRPVGGAPRQTLSQVFGACHHLVVPFPPNSMNIYDLGGGVG